MFVHDPISILRSLAHNNKENLKRHLLLHRTTSGSTKHPCFYCDRLFSRRDLRKRHIKKQHPQCEPDPEYNPEADGTTRTIDALIEVPDARMHAARQDTVEVIEHVSSKYRTPPLSADDDASLENQCDSMLLSNRTDVSPINDLQQIVTAEELGPTHEPFPMTLIQRGIELYFRHISPYLPFIHQHTFGHSDMPEALIMGMLSIGLQFDSEQETNSSISAQAFERGRKLLTQAEESDEVLFARNIHTIQAYLLLELYAAVNSGGRDTTLGLQMHHKSVEVSTPSWL
ncbi:hypothetical protein KCU65_g930, partial [Aureobasidium melanogenum]